MIDNKKKRRNKLPIVITEKIDGESASFDLNGIISSTTIADDLSVKIEKEKEQTVRNFLLAMKKFGYFRDVDVITLPLEELIARPDAGRGFRITAITRNTGTHKAYYKVHTLASFEVKEGETYVTVNTIAPMSGSVTTYKMEIVDGEYTITAHFCHMRS